MFYQLEVTENSKLVCYSVQRTKLNCINEVMFFMTSQNYLPSAKSTVCITLKECFFDQFGKRQTKYKKGKYSFFKYFTCYVDQFEYDLICKDMNNVFLNL